MPCFCWEVLPEHQLRVCIDTTTARMIHRVSSWAALWAWLRRCSLCISLCPKIPWGDTTAESGVSYLIMLKERWGGRGGRRQNGRRWGRRLSSTRYGLNPEFNPGQSYVVSSTSSWPLTSKILVRLWELHKRVLPPVWWMDEHDGQWRCRWLACKKPQGLEVLKGLNISIIPSLWQSARYSAEPRL